MARDQEAGRYQQQQKQSPREGESERNGIISSEKEWSEDDDRELTSGNEVNGI